MFITNDVKYIGVNDREIDLFEGQYIVPNGIAYNSYTIVDERVAIMDTVDARFKDEWFDNIEKELSGREPDAGSMLQQEPQTVWSSEEEVYEYTDNGEN